MGLTADLWVEDIAPPGEERQTAAFAAVDLAIGAGAPIYAGEELVGLLSLGVGRDAHQPLPARKAGLLAAAIDDANILSVLLETTSRRLR